MGTLSKVTIYTYTAEPMALVSLDFASSAAIFASSAGSSAKYGANDTRYGPSVGHVAGSHRNDASAYISAGGHVRSLLKIFMFHKLKS